MQGENVIENLRRNVKERTDGRQIGDERKAGVNLLVVEKSTKLMEEWLDDIFSMLYNKAQSGVRPLCMT